MNVAVTWWEIYFIDRALDTVRQNQSLLRQLVEVAQTKYEVGNGLQQDVLLAQLELSKLLDREITLTSMREQRAIRLNVLMGSSPNQPVELPTMVAQPDAAVAADELLYQRALASRPLLNQQSATLKAAESRLDLARKDYYPDFNLGVTYGQRDDDEMGQSRTDFLSVMLSVNIPLYAESRQSNAVSQRARELARNQYALLDQRNGVMSSISIAKSEYQRASAQIRLFGQGIIPQARQTVASMMGGYQVGQVDFLNLVRSQMTLFDYELQYWRAFTEVSQSIARLEAAVGGENIYE
jgi:outer membrane protein TolC